MGALAPEARFARGAACGAHGEPHPFQHTLSGHAHTRHSIEVRDGLGHGARCRRRPSNLQLRRVGTENETARAPPLRGASVEYLDWTFEGSATSYFLFRI